MNERREQRKRPPLIHGRMIYNCGLCGNSWPMYLEKGIEEFGENHKPSPFTITCPYCDGLAMDVSGIQKVLVDGYVPLPDGYGYFANVEGRDCGVPTFPRPEAEKKAGKAVEIIIADEIDGLLREREMELAMEAIAGYAMTETKTREILKAASEMALWKGYSLEEIIGAIMNAVAGGASPKKVRRAFADFKNAWDWKEDRERRRAAERVNAARFSRQKARELGWRQQKRTRPRRREYRGPDIV
ncbi:MAG: hypothetical protein HFF08_10670 [Oscillospiraceae bacterium]|nr:hypothetical protein [Oscillospiraceae bacterium]